MPTRIGVIYGHVASNLGDLAINAGLCTYLARTYGDCSLKVALLNAKKSNHLTRAQASFSGFDEIEFVDVSSSPRWAHRYAFDPAQFLDDFGMQDRDLIVYHPGEHLFSYEAWDNSHPLFWRMLPALGAKLSGKKFVVLPSTFGPFEDSVRTGAVSAMLGLADAVAAREPISARTVEAELKLPRPVVLPDLGFFLDPPRQKASSDTTPTLGLIMRLESFGMRAGKERSARVQARYETRGFEDSQSFAFSVALIERFTQAYRGNVHLFIQTVRDEKLAEAIVTEAQNQIPAASVQTSRPESVTDYMNGLAEVDYIVAARFHAVVLGLTAGVPAIGVYFSEHGPKMPGLFEWLSASQLAIPLSAKPAAGAAADVVTALPAAAKLVPATQRLIREYRARAEDWLKATEGKPIGRTKVAATVGAIGGLTGGLGELLDETTTGGSDKTDD